MVTNVTRATMSKAIMQNFLDLMRDNIEPVILPDPSTSSTKTFTIERVSTSYPDTILKKKDNYPLILVSKPELPEIPLTYKNIQVQGNITLDIHSTNSLATTEFYDQMKELIIISKKSLAGVGIKDIKFTEDDGDTETRNGFKDHWANFTLSFMFEYTDGY